MNNIAKTVEGIHNPDKALIRVIEELRGNKRPRSSDAALANMLVAAKEGFARHYVRGRNI